VWYDFIEPGHDEAHRVPSRHHDNNADDNESKGERSPQRLIHRYEGKHETIRLSDRVFNLYDLNDWQNETQPSPFEISRWRAYDWQKVL